MTPVLHFSAGSISLIPRANLLNPRKQTQLKKCTFSKRPLTPQFNLIQFSNLNSLSNHKSLIPKSAVEADVAVESETDPTETEPVSEKTEPEQAPPAGKTRPVRKAVPKLKDEELIPGNTYKGVIRSIQPFGLFVDFGAFSDGLVHISQVSSSFVQDIKALFTVGQEVEVRLLEADKETRRIALSMRDPNDQKSERGRGGGPKRGGGRKPRYSEGDMVFVTVTQVTEEGAMVSMPFGGEAFLPVAEVAEDYGELEVETEIQVWILDVDGGEVTVTMKEEEEKEQLWKSEDDDEGRFRRGRGRKGRFDDEDEEGDGADEIEDCDDDDYEEEEEEEEEGEEGVKVKEIVGEEGEDSVVFQEKGKPVFVNPFMLAFLKKKEYSDNMVAKLETIEYAKSIEAVGLSTGDVESEGLVVSEDTVGVIEEIKTEEESKGEVEEVKKEEDVVGEIEEVKSEEVIEGKVEETKSEEDIVGKIEETKSEEDVVGKIEDVKTEEETKIEETKVEEVSAGNVEEVKTEEVSVGKTEEVKTEEVSVGKTEETETEVASVDSSESSDQGKEIKATISPKLVKQLREETGAGMMDCKNALSATNGDLVKAQEYLRKKGLLSADKKSSRATAEGRIGSYIHDGRIGVLVEVNCETDFVSRGDIFTELVEDLAMQVAACPQVTYLTSEDVPVETVNKEKQIEMQREDLQSKPENIRERIVEGRIKKRLEEFALLEQPFIKNDKMIVNDHVKQTITTIGENIKVKRFVRFNLGEGLEKKSQDFAAEVAAQTAAKNVESPPAPKEETAEATVEKEQQTPTPTVTISPALVKQLREETGAGMMDCKKALSETGGDITKAQEYLRKKGLSSADKKSSRIAAEGLISAYIHDARIGCLIEVNSETDFVARNEKFKELADDLAMQVVACPQVQYVSIDEIPASLVAKEKEIEMQREDLQSKPEQIRERIVEGRISKRLGELALLEQPFIKDDSITVKELVKRTVAALGENIKVRRFVRFTLGESKE